MATPEPIKNNTEVTHPAVLIHAGGEASKLNEEERKTESKRAAQRDQLVQAQVEEKRESLAKQLLENPLANQAPDGDDGPYNAYFPPPGLAYYIAEAMMMAMKTDANAMHVYANLESALYQNMSKMWDVYRIKDMETLQNQAASTFWGAGASCLTALATGAIAGIGLFKMGSMTKGLNELTEARDNLKSNLTGDGVFNVGQKDLMEVEQQLGIANEEAPVAEQRVNSLRARNEQYERLNEAESFAKANVGEADWGGKVDEFVADKKVTLTEEREALLTPDDEIAALDLDTPEGLEKAVSLRARNDKINEHFNGLEAELDERGNAMKANQPGSQAEVKEYFKEQRSELGRSYDVEQERLDNLKDAKQTEIDKADTKVKAEQDKVNKMQTFFTTIQGFGQLGNALQIGQGSAQLDMALTTGAKDKADKAKTLDSMVINPIEQAWGKLLQNASATISAYQQEIQQYNSVQQRA